MSEWQLTVGLEIHVELETKTKMFCGCPNDPFHSRPNVNVCPVCYGLPGALPLLNKKAIELVVSLGQALNGQIAEQTFWARKNYFYPDLPKGYQISQSTAPLVGNAALTINGQEYQIERIHLEEDAGKLTHDAGSNESLVDYNRAGVPLMELVTKPVFHTPEEAKMFCQELQRIVRSLKISTADMEKGQMRCEANISVAPTNSKSQTPNSKQTPNPNNQSPKLGTKVEVKNINSFRAVEKAIRYEFDRQVKALELGQVISQETRTWNDPEGKTVNMRSKEESADYRYFPEPDLPSVIIDVKSIQSQVVLPDEQRKQLVAIGLPKETIQPIIDRYAFEPIMAIEKSQKGLGSTAAKMFLDFPRYIELELADQLELIKLRQENGWTGETTVAVLEAFLSQEKPLAEVAKEFSSATDLSDIITAVISENPAVIASYRAGKEQAFNFLVGQVMVKAKGRANITAVRDELKKALS